MMTDEMMSLRRLLEKSSDADLLREMVEFVAQRLMELEVESLTGAGHGERSPERINHRNGYRDRIWETRAGAVEDAITRLVGAILLEQNDEWAVQRARYMTRETMAPPNEDPILELPAVAA
jgi:transposase-like protein